MKDNIAYLRINSWQGKSPGAVHFYGNIVLGNYKYETDVKRKLTKIEAADLRRMEKLVHGKDDFRWQEGDNCPAFLTREACIRAAKKIYKKSIAPAGAIALVIGNRALMEPQPIACVTFPTLHGKIMKQINKLARERQDLDTRYSDYHEHEGASDLWREDYDKMMKEWTPLFEQLENA